MEVMMWFLLLAIMYCMAYFFDRFFKSCMHYPYEAFLKKSGFVVSFMCFQWHTTAFNRTVLRWGTAGGGRWRTCLTRSFTAGVFLSLSLLPVGIILLFITIFNGDDSASSPPSAQLEGSAGARSAAGVKVELLLPGVNLPLDEVGYYTCAMLLSTVVHELGHAIAAVLEDVPVTGFGFHIYFCLPLAITEISNEHLNGLKWFRKLRILCGGIWHNFLFAAFCYLLLSTVGFMTRPLFTYEKNVIITAVDANSPLNTNDNRGMVVGNVITHINDCPLHNKDSWYDCLLRAMRHKPGYCVSSDFIRLNDESIEIASHHGADGILQCCDAENFKLNCFEYIDDLSNDAPVEIPQHVCLNVRRTIEDSYGYCTSQCDRGFCLRPLLRNTTVIMVIKRVKNWELESSSSAPPQVAMDDNDNIKILTNEWRDIIYVGHPVDVLRSVHVSTFIPKQHFFSSNWGDAYITFLKYNVVFSLGLAIINTIPCFFFDGSHITNTIINSFLANRVVERPKRDVVALIVTCIGTSLFGCAVFKVVWTSASHLKF